MEIPVTKPDPSTMKDDEVCFSIFKFFKNNNNNDDHYLFYKKVVFGDERKIIATNIIVGFGKFYSFKIKV